MRQEVNNVVPFHRNFSENSAGAMLVLTPAELSALEKLTCRGRVFAVSMYLFGFRKRMDRPSGIVGEVSALSYKMLDEIVERRPDRTSNWSEKKRSLGQLRSDIKVLRQTGLLEPVLDPRGQAKPLVFFLPLAISGQIRPNEAEHQAAHLRQQKTPYKLKTCPPEKTQAVTDAEHTSYIILQPQERDFLETVVALYHQALPNAPKVRLPHTTPLHQKFRWLLDHNKNFHQAEFWRWYFFKAVPASDFLMGRVVPNARRGKFQLNFSGLLSRSVVEQLINGGLP